MEFTVLAITNGDRLLAGLIALLLCLLALILWLFPIILLGRLWRHMTRPQRTRGMRGMIAILFLLTAGLLVAVPHTSYEVMDDPVSKNDDDQIFIESRCVGITSWYVRQERTSTNPSSVAATWSTDVSVIGMLAILPALAAMWLIAGWLWREMPGFYRRPDGRCDVCDYDLHGSRSPACPECGEMVA